MSPIKIAHEIEPHWLNKSQMAASAGISIQAFDKWGVQPVAKVGRSVYFTVSDVLNNRVVNEVAKHQPKLIPEDQLDEGQIEYERYRLTKAQADGQEFKNNLAQGESVKTNFATFALSKISAEGVGVLDSFCMNMQRKHPDITPLMLENMKRELAKVSNIIASLDEKLPDILNEYIADTTG